MAGRKDQPTVMKECNICGSEVEENADYCPECGADFTGEIKSSY